METEPGRIQHHLNALEKAVKASELHGIPEGVPPYLHETMLYVLSLEIEALQHALAEAGRGL